MQPNFFSRRTALKSLVATAALTSLGAHDSSAAAAPRGLYRIKNKRIRQSVVPWCFNPMTVAELAKHAASMGLESVELCEPETWPELKRLGLTCAIAGSHGFAKGFAHTEEHEECIASLKKCIAQCAQFGVPSLITFSGFRRGISDAEGTKNMIEGLKKIAPTAEKAKVTLCLEMLNSRVNLEMKGHPDYFCDHMDAAMEIVKQVGSEYVKVLFDVYHVEIMDGDVIRRIKQYAPWIGHFHTAGNPGRNEIDDSQEINYAPIMKAIVESGYKGFVGHEFIPLRDKLTSLSQAVRLCDV